MLTYSANDKAYRVWEMTNYEQLYRLPEEEHREPNPNPNPIPNPNPNPNPDPNPNPGPEVRNAPPGRGTTINIKD